MSTLVPTLARWQSADPTSPSTERPPTRLVTPATKLPSRLLFQHPKQEATMRAEPFVFLHLASNSTILTLQTRTESRFLNRRPSL
ncbi:hypothetical protein FRC18_005749 [Serendipita sp. 400]|nr:hypothetical protein FRC18_005749 [Serendipita sp. 400]